MQVGAANPSPPLPVCPAGCGPTNDGICCDSHRWVGGCESLISAIVNDAASTVEIKPLLPPSSLISKWRAVI